ncbi:MAG: glutamine--fructose-6-phosphate transaminase (isomerizing), partial [Lachnospiraceae bacterium]
KPDKIYSVRNVSPIVAAKTPEGTMLASDVTAIGRYTKKYFVVPEYHVLEIDKENITLTDFNGKQTEPEYLDIDFALNMSEKGGFPFYMEKEMTEQPKVIADMLEEKTKDGLPDFSKEGVPDELFTDCENVCVVACGSAMHAGLAGQSMMKKFLHIPVTVELASEFMYNDPVVDEKTLVIAVSQSGETIDTLEALKYAKKHGAKSLAVINVKGSSIARESGAVLYTNAGPEIAVASTKAYTTQLAMFYLILARMAYLKKIYKPKEAKAFISELSKGPQAMEAVLKKRHEIHVAAREVLEAKDLFMIGRGLDHSLLLEGSLKLKEVSYIHSEAYASGELKHGPIALITDRTPVVAVATQEKILHKEISNIREVRSRGAKVLIFVKEQFAKDLEKEFSVIKLPNARDEMMVFSASVALQLFAYYVSSDKGFDVDKPRNLAKVVTVE